MKRVMVHSLRVLMEVCMKKSIKEMLWIHLGMILLAIGLYFFLIPNQLVVGGANGLGIVAHRFLPSLSVGFWMLIINLILFSMSFLFIGNEFGLKTIYTSVGVSFMVMILEGTVIVQESLTGELFLDMVFGILISGIGIGIVFNQNASTGGTDIIAKILHKYFHMDLGKGLFLADFMITVTAWFAFGPKFFMYAVLGLIFNGFVIDSILEGINISKEVTIVSDFYESINHFILHELERGTTLLHGMGGFTQNEKKIIKSVMGRRDFAKLKNFILETDPNAFLLVNQVHEVFGEGFKRIHHI
jgi:uncharacterized membrane-anchored protein YitT (DUF2179 family)